MIDLNNISPTSKKEENNSSSLNDLLNKDISFSKRFSDKNRKQFYDQLGTLLEAGIDIRTALELTLESFKKTKTKTLLDDLLNKIIEGAALSEAMLQTGEFDNYEYQSVQIGEETGKLSRVLKQLCDYYESKINQKRQIINALSYPLVVMSVSLMAVTFMIYFVVPMFADVFKRFGGELPAITQYIIDISNYFIENISTILFILVGAITSFILLRNKPWMRNITTEIVLRTPIAGNLTRKIYMTRFCTIMDLLISSKIPLLRSIQLIKTMIPFLPLERALTEMETDILKGIPMHTSMGKHAIFETQMVSLIKVGEEVNKIDEFFSKLAIQYTDDVEHQTKTLGSLVEPLLLIFLGGVVGTILVAMYLPMFSMSNSFGG